MADAAMVIDGKATRVGWWGWLMLVVVCFVLLCFVIDRLLANRFVEI